MLACDDRLGLRPTAYAMSTGHPDNRPCPTWCWVERSGGEHQHEIFARHPMKALHHIDAAIRTVASLYSGEPALESGRSTNRHRNLRVGSHPARLRRPVLSVDLRRGTTVSHAMRSGSP